MNGWRLLDGWFDMIDPFPFLDWQWWWRWWRPWWWRGSGVPQGSVGVDEVVVQSGGVCVGVAVVVGARERRHGEHRQEVPLPHHRPWVAGGGGDPAQVLGAAEDGVGQGGGGDPFGLGDDRVEAGSGTGDVVHPG